MIKSFALGGCSHFSLRNGRNCTAITVNGVSQKKMAADAETLSRVFGFARKQAERVQNF